MSRVRVVLVLMGLATAGGCVSNAQFLDEYQAAALSTARIRGQFELSCNQVDTTVLSRKIIQPVMFGGIERAEYTVGVRGCGRQTVYWTMCLDQQNCNALADTGRIDAQMAP